jgi:hypothetical protein
MDFTNLLKAIEEFLYELVAWVIFYPLTLFRTATRPLDMMRYAERELGDKLDEQYDDALSPPIFLVITLLLAHLIQMAIEPALPGVMPEVFRDERNLLLFRAIALSLFPLLLAFGTVRRRGAKLTRKSLRPAFYAQCFVAGPFILMAYLGLAIGLHGGIAGVAGLVISGLGLLWYGGVQTVWLMSLGVGGVRAGLSVAGTLLLGLIAVLVFSAAATLAAGGRIAG